MIVADAPAIMPGKGLFDLCKIRGWILVQKRLGGHNDARCAKTALKSGMVNEGLLKRIDFSRLLILEAFNGRDLFPMTLYGEYHAGQYRFPIHEYRARGAGALVTTYFCAGEAKVFSQGMGKSM